MVDLSKLMQDAATLEVIERSADECRTLSAENSAQAMRIDELQAEIGRLRLDAATWWKKVSDLEAENAALRADAERYRWLRLFAEDDFLRDKAASDLDAAIDAARNKT